MPKHIRNIKDILLIVIEKMEKKDYVTVIGCVLRKSLRNMKFSIRLTILFCAVLFSVNGATAQGAALKTAKRHMDNLNYQAAIQEYSRIVEKSDVAEAKINLAEAYRKIGDSDNAEFWYSQVVRLPEAEPVHSLYYGQMLQRNGKCDVARDWYNKYIELVPSDQRGQYLARACDYEEELMQKNADIYEITPLDFNSNLDDFSPAIFNDQIIFASERAVNGPVHRESTWTGESFLELYEVVRKKENGVYTYSRPEKYAKNINSKYHDAAVSFSKKKDEIFFTRNNLIGSKVGKSDEGIIKLKVFSAKSAGEEGKWGELESLPFNSDEYSVAHPSLSGDGMFLYFASDMPGGFGGMDIYRSEKESGRWGPPMNLGPNINTEGNEIFPSSDMNTGRLYFSSDGLIGLGGLDLFYTEDRGNNDWTSPENLGYPINTVSDDFALILEEDGRSGYFTSDRSGGVGGDDIYAFKKIAVPMEVYVFDETTSEPLEGATVNIGCKGVDMMTGSNGKVIIDIKPGNCCDFKASMEEYEENTAQGCATEEDFTMPQMIKIPLKKAKSFELSVLVFDAESGLTVEGAEVSLEADCEGEVPPVVYTDASGRATFELKEECCYRVKAMKQPTYLAGFAENLCTKGMNSSETLEATINLQPTIVTSDITNNIQNGGTTTNPAASKGYYEDPVTRLYIDEETGEYANDTYPDGSVFTRGVMVSEPTQTAPTYTETTSTTDDAFVQSGSTKDLTVGEAIPFLLHIYYDFNKSYIRDDAETELQKLLTVMSENPDIIIEIGSHTDSRASDRYNIRLSQRRAESVVRWLVSNGVERERLVPRGYGETMRVNDCANNVPCSERDHQLNRRTEFKVIGCRSCGADENKILSRQNEDVHVDECIGCPF